MTPTVFIVDDDAALRAALRQLLEGDGLAVEVFADGAAFLAACRHDAPSCVLLDMAMPGLSGQEVQEALTERGLQLPVIFLTGHGDIPMAVQATQAGALDFLEKPIQGTVLLERVHRALALDEERRQSRDYAAQIRQRHARLSARQREIMALVVTGRSSKEIARLLDISPRTVESHRMHVMYKMGAENIVELTRMARHCPDCAPAANEPLRGAT